MIAARTNSATHPIANPRPGLTRTVATVAAAITGQQDGLASPAQSRFGARTGLAPVPAKGSASCVCC